MPRAVPQPPGAEPRPARALEHALAGIAFACLGFWAFEAGATRYHAGVQERRLARLAPSEVAPSERAERAPRAATATRAELARSGLVGQLEIARLGMRVVVEEGVDRRTLRRAAGHVPGTALPGEAGNVVLAAHRDTLFAKLEHVAPRDRLRFVTPDGSFEYEVVEIVVVAPTDTRVMAQGEDAEATLVTCHPFGYVGPAPQRFVVRARAAEATPGS